MSTLTKETALEFLAQVRSGRPRLFVVIHLIAAAVREGHAAARHYQALRGRGVPRDAAARVVFAEHHGRAQ